jgi:hypothetical protein
METPEREWERVARDLRSYRKEQRRRWGDLDEALLARYLTGGCTPDEKREVERARREFPRVNESLELVARVMQLPIPALAGAPQLLGDYVLAPIPVEKARAVNAGDTGRGREQSAAGVTVDDRTESPLPAAPAATFDTIPIGESGQGTIPITDDPLTMPERPTSQPASARLPLRRGRSGIVWALAACLLVAVGALGWVLNANHQLRDEARQLREQQHPDPADLKHLEAALQSREAELAQLRNGSEREAALRRQLDEIRNALREAEQATRLAREKGEEAAKREQRLRTDLQLALNQYRQLLDELKQRDADQETERAKALVAFETQTRQARTLFASLKVHKFTPDYADAKVATPKGANLLYRHEDLKSIADHLKTVSLGDAQVKCLFKVWGERKADGKKVNLGKYAWKPEEEFYLHLESAVPLKLAIYEDFPGSKSVLRLPDPEELASLDVIKPGEVYKVPAVFNTDKNGKEEWMRLVFAIAGSGDDPQLRTETDTYTFKGVSDYIAGMEKIAKETRDKPAGKVIAGPKATASDRDEVADLVSSTEAKGYVLLRLKKP